MKGYQPIIQNWEPHLLGTELRLGEDGEWAMITDQTEFAVFIESASCMGWIPLPIFYEDTGANDTGENYAALPLWLFQDHDDIP